MLKRTLLGVFLTSALLNSAHAQLVSWVENSPRMLTRIGLWNQAAQTVEGQFSIQYGMPTWQDSYDGMASQARDKSLRLGKDFWTTLDNDIPIKIGGVSIPVGQHYLGLACDKNGAFKLMIMNGATVKSYKTDGWNTGKLRAKINAPLVYAKVKTKRQKLSIQFIQNKKTPTQAKLVIHWGNHQLTAKVKAIIKPKADDASASKKRVSSTKENAEKAKTRTDDNSLKSGRYKRGA